MKQMIIQIGVAILYLLKRILWVVIGVAKLTLWAMQVFLVLLSLVVRVVLGL